LEATLANRNCHWRRNQKQMKFWQCLLPLSSCLFSEAGGYLKHCVCVCGCVARFGARGEGAQGVCVSERGRRQDARGAVLWLSHVGRMVHSYGQQTWKWGNTCKTHSQVESNNKSKLWLSRTGGWGLDLFVPVGQVAGFCRNGNEPLVAIKCRLFFGRVGNF
jgi:hypothetical protein